MKIKNGPCLDQLLGILLFFPKLRLLIEKILGKIAPSEFIAVAEYEKWNPLIHKLEKKQKTAD